ncbi:MAG TPA: germination protein YpeB [Bacillota bacterium]|nr:germination protein YpeB [Bacillota bacterium]
MYSKIAGVLTPILGVGVIGLGMWGYQENQEKNSILIKSENQYQRAFHDLSFHVDQLQDELGKTLAVNSREQVDGSLSNVWRIASMAQSDVGQLPLTLVPFNKTEEFLSKIADFSYKAAIRDLNKEPLSENEYQKLKNLHQSAMQVQSELHDVQTKVIDHHLRWMDVESALASEHQNIDNTIIDGFKTIDKTVDEYKDVDFGPGVQTLENQKRFDEKNLTGGPISADQAQQKVIQFLGDQAKSAQIKVDKTGKGYDYSAYSVSVQPANSKETMHIDVTRKGGHVAWLLDNRDVPEAKLTIDQAKQQAKAFLDQHGLKNMENYVAETYNNIAALTYVYTVDHVRVYPDIVTIKVALDNGEIVGYQGENHIFNHKENIQISTPKLTQDQARAKVNPQFKVQEVRKAIIRSDLGKEVLCYEFVGSVAKQTFRVYINAENGKEETIQKIDGI